MAYFRLSRSHGAFITTSVILAALGTGILVRRCRAQTQNQAEGKPVRQAGALRDLLTSTKQRLKGLPAGAPDRRKLIGSALEQLDRGAAEPVKHSGVDRETAVALAALGDDVLAFSALADELDVGDDEAEAGAAKRRSTRDIAVSLHRRSTEIFEFLARQDRARLEARRDLAASYEKLAGVYSDVFKSDEQIKVCRRCVELREALRKEQPNDSRVDRELANAYQQLGDADLAQFSVEEALKEFARSLALREAVARVEPASAAARREVAVLYGRIAAGLRFKFSSAEALKAYEKGIDWVKPAKQSALDKGGPARNVAEPEERRQVVSRNGATISELAIRCDEKEAELEEALAQSDPDPSGALFGAAVNYNNLGFVYSETRQHTKAVAAFQKAINLTRLRQKADPADPAVTRELVSYYTALGNVYLEAGGRARALLAAHQAIGLGEPAARADPSDVQAADVLSNANFTLGDVYLRTGLLKPAIWALERTCQLIEPHATAKNGVSRLSLQGSYSKLGEAYLKSGAGDKAIRAYRKAIEPMEAQARIQPDSGFVQRTLAGAVEELGDAYMQLRQTDKALVEYQRGLRIRLAVPGPDQPVAQATRELATSRMKLGRAQDRAGDVKEAVTSFEGAVAEDPSSGEALHELARLLATSWDKTVRDGKRAVELANEACEIADWKDSSRLATLAAACAEAGEFDDAEKWQNRAIGLVTDKKTNAEYAGRLKLYKERKPYHERRPARAGAAHAKDTG